MMTRSISPSSRVLAAATLVAAILSVAPAPVAAQDFAASYVGTYSIEFCPTGMCCANSMVATRDSDTSLTVALTSFTGTGCGSGVADSTGTLTVTSDFEGTVMFTPAGGAATTLTIGRTGAILTAATSSGDYVSSYTLSTASSDYASTLVGTYVNTVCPSVDLCCPAVINLVRTSDTALSVTLSEFFGSCGGLIPDATGTATLENPGIGEFSVVVDSSTQTGLFTVSRSGDLTVLVDYNTITSYAKMESDTDRGSAFSGTFDLYDCDFASAQCCPGKVIVTRTDDNTASAVFSEFSGICPGSLGGGTTTASGTITILSYFDADYSWTEDSGSATSTGTVNRRGSEEGTEIQISATGSSDNFRMLNPNQGPAELGSAGDLSAFWVGSWAFGECPALSCCPSSVDIISAGPQHVHLTLKSLKGDNCAAGTSGSDVSGAGVLTSMSSLFFKYEYDGGYAQGTGVRQGGALEAVTSTTTGEIEGAKSEVGCFSSGATVTLQSGASVPVSQLKVGDYVQSVAADGRVVYDKVFRFTHHDTQSSPDFLRIITDSGAAVELTPNHMLHVGTCCSLDTLKLAAEVDVGDRVFVVREGAAVPSLVTAVEHFQSPGTFNVHTLGGNIVVDGVAASHFSTETTWGPSTRAYSPYWYKVVDSVNMITGPEDASPNAATNLRGSDGSEY